MDLTDVIMHTWHGPRRAEILIAKVRVAVRVAGWLSLVEPGFQTEKNVSPYFSWSGRFPLSICFPSTLALTLLIVLLPNQYCDGSLQQGLQCCCCGHSSVRPICALPCELSGFSLTPLCRHGLSFYRGSGTHLPLQIRVWVSSQC